MHQYFLSRSLLTKMLLVFVPLVFLAEFLVFGFQAWSSYQNEKADLVEKLESVLEIQVKSLAYPMWEFDTDEITSNIGQLKKLNYFESIGVYDDGGELIASLGNIGQPPDNAAFKKSQQVEVIDADTKVAVGRIDLTVHGRTIYSDLIKDVKFNAVILAVLVLTLIGGVYITTRSFISTPLRKLEQAIENQDGKPVEWNSSDELGTVVLAYNDMQQRQQAAEAEVIEYQNHLEELVKARTIDLRRALSTITSSIEYASRIQRSMLPEATLLNYLFVDHFLIWEPREPVGGDMIWSRPWGDGHILINGDCTGHGVPGAFMTLIVASALERALVDVQEGETLVLLQTMNRLIKLMQSQHKGHPNTDDGLELGLCYLPENKGKLHFIGARFNLYCLDDTELREIKGTKLGVGYLDIPDDQEYAVHEITVNTADKYYLVSDGFTDQVGGEQRAMLGKRRFKNLLEKVSAKPFAEQKNILISELCNYQGDEERRDDVSAIGFQIAAMN
jgi:serine phosphatase RsbU (regulator of sigma subunit)/uncharacterized membrane protein affecting hemolysin expression